MNPLDPNFGADPFEGEPTGSQGQNQPAGGQPDGSTPTPKDDPERYQYWQSRYDQSQRELQTLRSEMDNYKPMLDALRTSVSPQQDFNQPPQAPRAPQRPSNYDPRKAISDPSSEDARYFESLSRYNEDMVRYNDWRLQQEMQREQILSQQAQQIGYRQQAHQVLIQQHGLAPSEANEFIEEFSSPDSVSMENLVDFWRFKRSNAAQSQGYNSPYFGDPPSSPQRGYPSASPAPQPAPQSRSQAPPPPTVFSGSGRAAPENPHEEFSNSLIGWGKR